MRRCRRLCGAISMEAYGESGAYTGKCKQLVGHKYGRVVLVSVEGLLPPVAKIFLHYGAIMHYKMC
jgi:hypothetical protein